MKILSIVLILIIIVTCIPMMISDVYALGVEVRDQEGRIVATNQESVIHRDPLKLGIWAFPIIITNLILLLLGILFYKKRLPELVKKTIRFILNFEVSEKIALIVVVSLIAIYISSNIEKIWNSEEESWGDYQAVVKDAKNWSVLHVIGINGFFRFLLLSISINILGNIRIIPFIVSISLFVLTYYFSKELSKKRFAGIISMIILLQSNLFFKYSVSATEDNTWILFYILSLYLIYKKWFLSPVSYGLSILAKPLTALFLPMMFFFIYSSSLLKKEKTKIILIYVITIIIPAAILIYLYRGTSFYSNGFLTGFTALENYLYFDGFILIFLIPLIVGLFLASKKGILHADSMMIFISGVLWSAPLLAVFSDITNQPYRFVLFVVFFAIGISILFSNNVKTSLTIKKNYIPKTVFLFTIITVIISETLVIFPDLILRNYRLVLTG